MEKNIIEIVTVIVTLVLGVITKKYTNLSSKKIPIQNLLIGIIVAIVEFIITKDFSTAIAISGLTGGGVYDLIKNTSLLINGEIEPKIEESTLDELSEERGDDEDEIEIDEGDMETNN
jgi:uncharacterized membrane protein YeaQ/YmgE (transglycosylase-associated protein family)